MIKHKSRFYENIFGLLIILASGLFSSCNKEPDLTKEEVYQLLNEIIADDSLRLYTVCWRADVLAISTDYGFSDRDQKFINQQNEIFRDFKFEPERLRAYSRKKQKYISILIDSSCKVGILNHLSFPLVSVDRKRVVLQNTEDCNCMLGGHGGKYLFIKENGHWKKEKSFDTWISQNTNDQYWLKHTTQTPPQHNRHPQKMFDL
jgi:hypothetical protein